MQITMQIVHRYIWADLGILFWIPGTIAIQTILKISEEKQ